MRPLDIHRLPVELLDPRPDACQFRRLGRAEHRLTTLLLRDRFFMRAGGRAHGHYVLLVDLRGDNGSTILVGDNRVRSHQPTDNSLAQSPGGLIITWSCPPVSGFAVNMMPAASAGTNSCTTTARLTEPKQEARTPLGYERNAESFYGGVAHWSGSHPVHTPFGEPFLMGTVKPLPSRDGVMCASTMLAQV